MPCNTSIYTIWPTSGELALQEFANAFAVESGVQYGRYVDPSQVSLTSGRINSTKKYLNGNQRINADSLFFFVCFKFTPNYF